MYATDEGLTLLCDTDTLFMDGTFKTAPKLFMQTYIIHGVLGESTVPVLYSYLKRKNKEIYNELFTAIPAQCTHRGLVFNPTYIHIDFEDAVIRSWRAVMGAASDITCCFFHLCQSIFEHIQNLGLTHP